MSANVVWIPEWIWQMRCRPAPTTPGVVLDLEAFMSAKAMQQIRADLEQWHDQLNRAMREGL